jgi:hypothetical protein
MTAINPRTRQKKKRINAHPHQGTAVKIPSFEVEPLEGVPVAGPVAERAAMPPSLVFVPIVDANPSSGTDAAVSLSGATESEESANPGTAVSTAMMRRTKKDIFPCFTMISNRLLDHTT